MSVYSSLCSSIQAFIRTPTTFAEVQNKFFSLNLALQYAGSSWICVWNVKVGYSELDHAEPNQGLHCQIIMCDLHSCPILCNYASYSDYTDSKSVSTTMVKKSKKGEHCIIEVSWHILLYWVHVHHQIFSTNMMFCFHFWEKMHLTWHNLRQSYSQSIHATETVTCYNMHLRKI